MHALEEIAAGAASRRRASSDSTPLSSSSTRDHRLDRRRRHGAHSITSPRSRNFAIAAELDEAEQRDQQRRLEVHAARVADAEHQHRPACR